MKDGNSVYCIRDFVCPDFGILKFSKNKFYEVAISSGNVIVIHWKKDPKITLTVVFNLESNHFQGVPNFDDYFVTLQESRKLKLGKFTGHLK